MSPNNVVKCCLGFFFKVIKLVPKEQSVIQRKIRENCWYKTMISKKEFIIGLVIMFVLFMFVNGIIVSDINETMRTLKRPVVLHDTTSVMRYVDRYIHDTTVITKTKTEYIEKVSLSGRMQDYSEEKKTHPLRLKPMKVCLSVISSMLNFNVMVS